MPITTGPARDLPDTTVHHLFEQHAVRRPASTAVISGNRPSTYGEINDEAGRLAGQLIAAGVPAGSVVAVLTGRSVSCVTAMLAVWKAGCVYLPMDSSHPADRIAFVLQDADPAAVLCEPSAQPLAAGRPVVLLDGASRTAPAPRHDRAGAIAYLIYTSGSTGHPKGVLVSHRALLNVVLALSDAMACGHHDRWISMAPTTFDISIAEMCVPMATGASLVIPTDRDLGNAGALMSLIRDHAVTRMQAVPSQWRALLDAGFDQPGMTAMVGGEALPRDLARRLRAKVNILFNGYGPTETTVVSTLWPVPREPDSVAIGSPIANTTVSIVDEFGRRVGPGVAGELIIGGAGVAAGYLNRPDLTASRFVAGPAYRTGDRCRWRGDGTLEFLGRDDGQVKIRGQRVELGEVEARLSGFPGVTGIVAIVHEEALVVYVMPDAAATVTGADLRAYAATVVPSSMVPSSVVVLDRFPVTANGKVDRAALSRPGADEAAVVPTSFADPLTAALCDICRDVLEVAQVRPDDDLFDLGAHSLSVMQIVARVEQRWHITVSADVFYDADCIADAARAIGALTAAIS